MEQLPKYIYKILFRKSKQKPRCRKQFVFNLYGSFLIICEMFDGEEKTIWNNDRPASTLHCRPIRFRFVNESSDTILYENELNIKKSKACSPQRLNIKILKCTKNFI